MSESVAAFLRAELAPTPQRWRHALFVGLGATTALALTTALQIDTFFGALIAFTALQPHTLCSWSRMLRCIWIATLTAVLTTAFGSVLLQVPWLLLPCFFLVVSAVLYAIPVSSLFLEALAVLPPLTRTIYVGVFHPQHMGEIAFTMWAAYTVGIVTATVFGRLLSPEHPRDELAEALAASFRCTRQRLRAAGERFRDLERPPTPPEQPLQSALTSRLLLLDRARQEGLSRDDERLLMALMTTAERTESSLEIADALARQAAYPTYRQSIDTEVAALLACLDAALAGFEDTARDIDRRPAAAGAVVPSTESWPPVVDRLAALESRQLALRRAGAFAAVSVAEAANVNAFVDALRDLSLTLRTNPIELERLAAGDPTERRSERVPGSKLRFDPYAARFALKSGLATTIALQIPIAAGVDSLFSMVVAPFLVAQTSYGATIEKAPLRLLGVLFGGVLALAAMLTVMVNTDDVTVWLVAFFFISSAIAYTALGGPRVSYVAAQVAVTFIFVTVSTAPTTDVGLALSRAFGNFMGGVTIVAVFRLVAPDYAGRQLLARLHDLLGDVLALLPARDRPPPSAPSATLALHRDIGFSVADILRLVAEARLEGAQAGIAPEAAVQASGLAQRIAYRAVALCRGRPALPPLPAPLDESAAQVTADIRSHLDILRRILAARHTYARPGSRQYRAACAAAAEVATCPRPAVAAALQTFVARLDTARFNELAEWPAAATGALFAELAHLRRIVDLLPALDRQLVALCVTHEQVQHAPAGTLVPNPV